MESSFLMKNDFACLPIIPWMGGKRRLAKHLLPLFPNHVCYAEPFCGAAALFFMKRPSDVEVINDINGDLVNLYRILKHHPEEFARQFKWALSSRQLFKWLQITPGETLTDIQRAAKFFYLQKLAFGGKVTGQSFGTGTSRTPGLNLMRLEEDISSAHLRLSRTYIEHLPWQDVIKRYDREHTLFYCDPPYWATAGYGPDFGLEQYSMMAEMAKSIKGKMIISVNDIPEMHEAFSGLNFRQVGISYTVSGNGKSKPSSELIITNFA